jgi:4-amino-4-deoxy-L-arabinose transferase-like glycosyltransferase
MTKGLKILNLSVLALVAGILFYRDPYNASNLGIVPDEVEYSIGAHRLVTENYYTLRLDGRTLPPRYPPWFSLLFIAPAYVADASNMGNAIFPVTLAGIGGILLVFGLAERLSNTWGGLAAAATLLAFPTWRQGSRDVMSDVPCAALILLTAYLYLWLRRRPQSLPRCLLVGMVAAGAASIRTSAAACFVPIGLAIVLAEPRGRYWVRLLAATGPGVLFVAASLCYNYCAFGTPFRSGYQLWCPVPYDYRSLCLSLEYVSKNAGVLFKSGAVVLAFAALIPAIMRKLCAQPRCHRWASLSLVVLVGLLFAETTVYEKYLIHCARIPEQSRALVPLWYGLTVFAVKHLVRDCAFWVLRSGAVLLMLAGLVLVLLQRRRQTGKGEAAPNSDALRDLVMFTVLSCAPIVLLHLLYFYQSERFFLPLLVLLCSILGASFGPWLLAKFGTPKAATILLVLAIPFAARVRPVDPVPQRRIAADVIRERTPQHAWVISALDPVYLEAMANPNGTRRIIPISRSVEYASKVLAWRKIPNPVPAPSSPYDHRCKGLIDKGAEESVRFVALEQLGKIREAIREGTPVYLETSEARSRRCESDLKRLAEAFRLTETGPDLYQLDMPASM